jgi:hypothetical protein
MVLISSSTIIDGIIDRPSINFCLTLLLSSIQIFPYHAAIQSLMVWPVSKMC